MRGPLDFEHITELEQGARTAAQHLEATEQLCARAGESHPDDEDVTPADLLVAANHLRRAGDGEGTLLALREAHVLIGEGCDPVVAACTVVSSAARSTLPDAVRGTASTTR